MSTNRKRKTFTDIRQNITSDEPISKRTRKNNNCKRHLYSLSYYELNCIDTSKNDKEPELYQVPKKPNKNIWVAATHLHNFMLNNTLVDWMELYEKQQKSKSIRNRRFKNHKGIFNDFLKERGIQFEKKLIEYIDQHIHDVVTIGDHFTDDNVEKTIQEMKKGTPLIHSASLKNHKNNTYGIADLLVRNDFIDKLVTHTKYDNVSKSNLGDYHYVVIDIKHSTLPLSSDGVHVLNTKNYKAYKAQLCVYNQAVANIQGYDPQAAYLLGRRWYFTKKGITERGFSCLDRLGKIDFHDKDKKYIKRVKDGLEWIRNLKTNGKQWCISPPELDELYPNMCCDSGVWNKRKRELAKENHEITSLWYCGTKQRENAFEEGVVDWEDKNCTAELLKVGKSKEKTLQDIMDINRSSSGDKILPRYLDSNTWHNDFKYQEDTEFYVDFETFSDIFTPFDNLPNTASQEMLFMIGVGWEDYNGDWEYKTFVCKENTHEEELRIMKEFVRFIGNYSSLYHWSCAEPCVWDRACERHDLYSRRYDLKPQWKDMHKLFTKEPIVIKNCLSYSLKEVARAMYEHKMIWSYWDSNCNNGMDCQILAYNAYNEAEKEREKAKEGEEEVDIRKNKVMKDIVRYNEIDCKVLWEILYYLRQELV